jgi:hypothetical protein
MAAATGVSCKRAITAIKQTQALTVGLVGPGFMASLFGNVTLNFSVYGQNLHTSLSRNSRPLTIEQAFLVALSSEPPFLFHTFIFSALVSFLPFFRSSTCFTDNPYGFMSFLGGDGHYVISPPSRVN